MVDLNALSLPHLFAKLTRDGCLDRLIAAALDEDAHAPGDVTSDSIIAESQTARAVIVARSSGVVAGIEAVRNLHKKHFLGEFVARANDGAQVAEKSAIAEVRGDLRQILKLERITLNLLGRMCGIATLTRQYVDTVRGTNTVICDTRKTTPGLRNLEKYAVRCGGGTLHRLGLFDAALYKDNHLAGIPLNQLASKLTAAIESARSKHDLRFVEVEVDTLDQLRVVLAMQRGLIDMVLLDNMSLDQLRQAVKMRIERAPHVLLECSGGVTLGRVDAIAETGVDRISVGAITHGAPWLDIGMDIDA
jgi:nicotinate-nucleotide pyrophosphorylase (carboxylating)